MVAVYTGTGLGLFNTSITALGGASGGAAGLGQLRGGQYVNAATGNLVLQNLDESLLVRGLTAGFQRTYNSRGTVAGAGQDGWVTGFERNVALTTGTLNAAGSKMTLYTGDGQAQVFTYVSATGVYQSTDGDGAHDTLVWNAGSLTWTYTEGSTRREEQYADHADATLKGRLTRIRDLRSDGTTPAQYDIVYDGNNRISEVRSVDGSGTSADAILFGYVGSTTQLASISTREGGSTRSQVFYEYDGYGRLLSVLTDLTPDQSSDNTWNTATASANDGKLFKTTYAYVAASASDLRIASVSTSDGVTVAYTYVWDSVNGYRISKVTQGSAVDGSSQSMSFTYGTGSTDVTDDAGRTWTYQYDANKRLTAVLEPTVNGLRQITTYTYDTSDNLVRVSVAGDSANTATTTQLDTVYTYDANGNRTLQRDRLGNTVTWTYNAANQVATEIRYTVADADGLDPNHTGGTNQPGGALATTYVYDAQNRLRFVVDAAGEVRELVYATSGNGIGQVASERRYMGATYSGAFDEASLNAWATNATAMRRANSELSTFGYDAKGRLSQTVRYASVGNDVNGSGVFDAATALTTFVYDAQGLLRQQITVRGTTRTAGGTPPATSEVADYVYDGMGRLTDVIRRGYSTPQAPDRSNPANATAYANWLAANDATTTMTTYVYVDSSNQLRVTSDAGMVRTEARNAAGQLVSFSEANAATGATVTRTTQYFYDNTGRLRASQDASGARTYLFYDEDGRLAATVDGTGAVTRTVYDGIGRMVQTIGYAARVDTTAWLSGGAVVKTAL
ncbi:MAG: RHS repeat domain-containing protein, partial [Lysobacteraceae bacterium]